MPSNNSNTIEETNNRHFFISIMIVFITKISKLKMWHSVVLYFKSPENYKSIMQVTMCKQEMFRREKCQHVVLIFVFISLKKDN